MITTSNVPTANTSAGAPLLASSGTDRWVVITVENADVRLQYDGGDGSYLNGSGQGELVPIGRRLVLEGAAAKNAIYARSVGSMMARVTVQTGAA